MARRKTVRVVERIKGDPGPRARIGGYGPGPLEIHRIDVGSWSPEPNGQGQPTEVHLKIEIKHSKRPLVVQFKRAADLDLLATALMCHRVDCWGAHPDRLTTKLEGPKEESNEDGEAQDEADREGNEAERTPSDG